VGAVVTPVSMYGIGFDLLVGYRGRLYAVEVKGAGRKEELTDNERRASWTLPAYVVIDCVDDFLAEAEAYERNGLRAMCHGSDFGILLAFDLTHGKRKHQTYGKDTDNQRRALRLVNKIMAQEKLFKNI